QTNTGETVGDTAKVLAGYLDALVVRTAASIDEMKTLAAQDEMSVINAMSENEHPTQALADLSALSERFGDLTGIEVLYVGEGNNTATALALAVGRIRGATLTMLTPRGYGVPEDVMTLSRAFAAADGATVCQHHDIDHVPRHADVVYTTRWETTGT